MPMLRVPVLLSRDGQDLWLARTIAGPEDETLAETPSEAMHRLRTRLERRLRAEGALPWPDLDDIEIRRFPVEVRPEHRVGSARHPSLHTLRIDVPVAVGRGPGGTWAGVVPLGVPMRLETERESDLMPMLKAAVQQALQSAPPAALPMLLPGGELETAVLVVRDPRARKPARPGARTEDLESVAEPLGRGGRGGFGRAWGREADAASLADTIEHRRGGLMLLGEAGSGKTALLVEAARLLKQRARAAAAAASKGGPAGSGSAVEDDDDTEGETAGLSPNVPRFWMTSGPRLIAGMKYLGEWEERCERVVEELGGLDGVLCIEGLGGLLDATGDDASSGPAAFFLPYVQAGELRLVVEATPAELDACRRRLPAFAAALPVVRVPSMTEAEARTAMGRLLDTLAQSRGVECRPGVAEAVVRLFSRFEPYRAPPGPAAEFLRTVFSPRPAGGRPALKRGSVLSPADVRDRFLLRSGLPDRLVRDEVTLTRATVAGELEAAVIAQPAACSAATDVVMRLKAGLNDPGRPLGVLLFCGPTGTGKTELARALARMMFGHGEEPDRLVRLDLSEYADPAAAQRLLRAPDGQAPAWLRKVRERPFCVLLLDELDKADPSVHDVLLGVMDEGRLTDPAGRVTWFRSAVVVMTANIGVASEGPSGFAKAVLPDAGAAARAFFRPEFCNRIDAIVGFRPLPKDAVRRIAGRELAALEKREGPASRGLRVTWDEAVVDRLVAEGYDRRFGARPMQRAVERSAAVPLARLMSARPDLRGVTVHLSAQPDGTIMALASES